ncbi:hypothetical protein A7D00_0445 [Trichophyton violaceum]|uniref:ubiquitinyl hydrolase 1 n=1 Tax=Trichophyton violaceum TaxID=34388 RepID=A0A178FRV1_TRIVO|nr:hypothetical protein A7D00_0445 [Trichophyton violaceum]
MARNPIPVRSVCSVYKSPLGAGPGARISVCLRLPESSLLLQFLTIECLLCALVLVCSLLDLIPALSRRKHSLAREILLPASEKRNKKIVEDEQANRQQNGLSFLVACRCEVAVHMGGLVFPQAVKMMMEAERANVYSFFPTAREVPMPFHYQPHLHQQHLQHQLQLHHQHSFSAGFNDGFSDGYSPIHQCRPDLLLSRVYQPPCSDYLVHHQPIMANLGPDEMAEFQKLSNEYEPDLQGPLVGIKQSSVALSQEYAQADPIYVAKTSSLAQTHSHYRIMKGDGNCGWRAVAFGYFESLFALRDQAKIAQELARIKSFNAMFDAVGQQEHLYEIFVDATEELLKSVAEQIANNNQDENFIVDAFNNEWNSNAIITHFRLMTSAWMQLNRERYEAFLPMPIEQYCSRTVDTVRTEIDEIGLQALVDGVIEASGFDVQILYLDRSQGDEVNAHQLTPQRTDSLGVIKLLYRPGHYDLLYGSPQSPTPVNYQYSMTCDFSPWYPNSLNFDLNPVLMAVPSLPLDPANSPPHPAPAPSPYEYSYPMNPPENMIPHHTIPLPEPAPPRHATINLPLRSPPPPEDKPSELLIRMNPLVDPDMSCLPLTIPFRNSHFNQAHFLNAEFQPSQWDPSEIYKREKKPSSRSGSSSE